MNIIIRTIGILGILLFGTAFTFTYSVPGFVEDIGKTFIEKKAAEKTNEKIAGLKLKYSDHALVKLAAKMAKKMKRRLAN